MSSLSLSDFELRRVPKNRAHLPRTSSGSRSIALFITDVLRVNLPRILYVQELAALVEPHLVALAQILLHTLGVSFKGFIVGIGTDPADARIFTPDSPHQLLVLEVSPLLLPGCSSRGRRHTQLCFCLGVSPPSPPRQPGRSWRRDPFCRLQYGCRKDSLHMTSSTLLPLGGNALRWSPIAVATCWRKWGSVISLRRSTDGGPFASLTGRLRAKRPSSFTCVVTNWKV